MRAATQGRIPLRKRETRQPGQLSVERGAQTIRRRDSLLDRCPLLVVDPHTPNSPPSVRERSRVVGDKVLADSRAAIASEGVGGQVSAEGDVEDDNVGVEGRTRALGDGELSLRGDAPRRWIESRRGRVGQLRGRVGRRPCERVDRDGSRSGGKREREEVRGGRDDKCRSGDSLAEVSVQDVVASVLVVPVGSPGVGTELNSAPLVVVLRSIASRADLHSSLQSRLLNVARRDGVQRRRVFGRLERSCRQVGGRVGAEGGRPGVGVLDRPGVGPFDDVDLSSLGPAADCRRPPGRPLRTLTGTGLNQHQL